MEESDFFKIKDGDDDDEFEVVCSSSNYKVIYQPGHVIYSKSFEFSELEIVRNNTNLNVLSHLIRKISRLTDNDDYYVYNYVITIIIDNDYINIYLLY